jgi:hypothetical protein
MFGQMALNKSRAKRILRAECRLDAPKIALSGYAYG